MLFYLASRVSAAITVDVCSDYSSSNCNETTVGVGCVPSSTSCTEHCPMEYPRDGMDCYQLGGPNCVFSGRMCVLADDCSDVMPPADGKPGDFCAPNMEDEEDCFVAYLDHTGALICQSANATTTTTTTTRYTVEMFFPSAADDLSTVTTGLCRDYSLVDCENASVTQGVVCVESNGVCVEACEFITATDDATCKSYGTNCKLNDIGKHCEFAATCADVQVHQGAYVNGPCSPNMVLGVDCRIAENTDGSLVCFEDYVFAEECWDYSIDQQCPPSNTGVQCGVVDGSSCVARCDAHTIKATEDAICRSFGPNCKLSSAGTHCQLADTCSDILPPDCAVVGDYCAPNLVTREDCYITANPNGPGLVCTSVYPLL